MKIIRIIIIWGGKFVKIGDFINTSEAL